MIVSRIFIMKTQFILLSLGISVLSVVPPQPIVQAVAEFRCPVHLNSNGKYTMNIRVPAAGLENHSAILSLGEDFALGIDNIADEDDENWEYDIFVVSTANANLPVSFRAHTYFDGPGSPSVFSIGHFGDFLTTFRSLAIVHNFTEGVVQPPRTELVGASQLDSFLAQCSPGSLVNIAVDESGSSMENMSVRLGGGQGGDWEIAGPCDITSDEDENILDLPHSVYDNLIETILHAPAGSGVGVGGSSGIQLITPPGSPQPVFSGCTRELIESNILPTIDLAFGDVNGLSFVPEDYLEITNEERRECRLRVGTRDSHFQISPLLIPGLNFRISTITNSVQFCDPI